MTHYDSPGLTTGAQIIAAIEAACGGETGVSSIVTLNSNTASSGVTGRNTYERLFWFAGTNDEPTGVGVAFMRTYCGSAASQGILAYGFTGYRPPLVIESWSRTGTTVTINVDSGGPTLASQGYVTGDVVFCNGCSNVALNDTPGSDNAAPTITVTGPRSFTYTSPNSGTASGSGGACIALFGVANRRLVTTGRGFGLQFTEGNTQHIRISIDAYGGSITKEDVTGGVTTLGRFMQFGRSRRRHVHLANSSTGFTTTAIVADAGAQTFEVDRAMTSLVVGQPIWLQEVDGPNLVITTIAALIDDTHISAIVNTNLNAGALVGESAGTAGVLVHPLFNTQGTVGSSSYVGMFSHFTDGSRTNWHDQLYNPMQVSMAPATGALQSVYGDPHLTGRYLADDIGFFTSTAGASDADVRWGIGAEPPTALWIARASGGPPDTGELIRLGTAVGEDEYVVTALNWATTGLIRVMLGPNAMADAGMTTRNGIYPGRTLHPAPAVVTPTLSILAMACDADGDTGSPDGYHLKVIFSAPVISNIALRTAVLYEISPTLQVYVAAPEAMSSPSYVVLTTSEQSEGQLYSIVIHTVEAA